MNVSLQGALRRSVVLSLKTMLATCLAAPAVCSAAQVVVRVTGVQEPLGQIGCSLFSGPQGFPMDSSTARVVWLAAETQGVTCRFDNVPDGRYAVSVGHDLNRNRRVDTNLFGLPTEQWGVSNNARPTLRAPRFDEASFVVQANAAEVTIDIKVAQ
jgi:uncharacterized protein (DUF2141 family)